MRSLLLSLAVFSASLLPAQEYTQKAAPVQKTQPTDECYTHNLNRGRAAMARGEARTAIQFFNTAKGCPEVSGRTRRMNELQYLISKCEEQLGLKKGIVDKIKASASPGRSASIAGESSNARKNYPARASLLKDTLEDCYQLMVDEADRAYRLQYWEDAAALYRAAKNCADADQTNRQLMSERIVACRNAAENELFAKQQEAERQARHAIAANLADDAQELLQSTDRTLAFRLADFANQYVAPDDNPDCVQAMFDAWYYQNDENDKNHLDEIYRPVFCYELSDNLGENIQIKFQPEKNGDQLLWAFVPSSGDMFAWEMPSMKMVQAFGTGDGNSYKGFDFSPDGNLLFWGVRFFDLVSGGTRTHRIQVPSIGNWCFSERGDEFFYENSIEQNIYILNVREAFDFSSKRNLKNANLYQAAVEREFVTNVPPGLLTMRYVRGKFWLGYKDRIMVIGKTKSGTPWKLEKVYAFHGVSIPETVDAKDIRLKVFPSKGIAVLGYYDQTWLIELSKEDNSCQARLIDNGYPLAFSEKSLQVACQVYNSVDNNDFWLLDASTGDTLIRQRIPAYTNFEMFSGCFSPDGEWVAASSFYGNVNVWALKDSPTLKETELSANAGSEYRFSPDGNRLSVFSEQKLNVYDIDDPFRFIPVRAFPKGISGSANSWILFQSSEDSVTATNLSLNATRTFVFPASKVQSFSFDDTEEKYLAYQSEDAKITVRSIKTGELLASRSFGEGAVGMRFVPGKDEILIIQNSNTVEIGRTSAKIWSPFRSEEKPKSIRLQNYRIRKATLSNQGFMAFTNGLDVRIFEVEKPENEYLNIPALASESVQDIAFVPNARLIASAYTNGKVVFRDLQSGRTKLQLQAIPKAMLADGSCEIESMRFTENGAYMHIVLSNGRMFTYVMDPSFVRQAAMDENRLMQSFGVDYIMKYNLEEALYYPGNFERLAESGDAPLIRAFFRHFRGQAVESNNIERDKDYCDRALYLYERLDPSTQERWKAEMREMFEDYAMKLILRGSIEEARVQLDFIKRKFDHETILLHAHIALLKRDFPKASAHYSRYLLTQGDRPADVIQSNWIFESVENDLTQMRDYELIDPEQVDCFCSTVQLSNGFHNFCQDFKNPSTSQLSPADKMRWEIYQKRHRIENNALRHAEKAEILEDSYEKALVLAQANPEEGQPWLETTMLELAEEHRAWGVFERTSPDAIPHFEKAAQLLTRHDAQQKLSDTSRLSLLSSVYLTWGKHLLDAGKTSAAMQILSLGLETAGELSTIAYVNDTTHLRNYYDRLVGPLYEHIGTALLLEGRIPEAREAYEMANRYYVSFGLNSLFTATVSAFEKNEDSAFIDYGSIFHPFESAQAFYLLGLLSERFPENRVGLDSFARQLKNALSSKNPRLTNEEFDFWLANFKVQHFAAQGMWDSTVVWSYAKLESAKKCIKLSNTEDNWPNIWLDEHINVPYYLLLSSWNRPEALSEAIRLVEEAEDYIAKQDPAKFFYDGRETLKTNQATALIIRNQPGDRSKAIELYKHFVQNYAGTDDSRDILEKDIKDLKHVGVPWPVLPELEKLLRADEEEN